MNRESWLEKATDLLRPYFKEKGYEIPELVRVSCGWPSTRALSSTKRRLGECWHAEGAADGVKQIFISPCLSDSVEVLAVLTHELLHAALPDKVGHKKPFKKGCEALGLEGPATSTKAGPELNKLFETFLEQRPGLVSNCDLPEYPQSKLDKTSEGAPKKQTTRMNKIVCQKNDDHPETDIILRASKTTLALGIPSCWCGKEFIVENIKDTEDES